MRLLLVLALVTQAHAQRPVLIDQDGSAPDPGSSNQMAMMVLLQVRVLGIIMVNGSLGGEPRRQK